MAPESPAAKPVLAFKEKKTEDRLAVRPELRELQVVPPFVVFRMRPADPAANPVWALAGKSTVARLFFTVESWTGSQDVPPSVVFRMTPESPTANPELTVTKQAELKLAGRSRNHPAWDRPGKRSRESARQAALA
jgi:hypothetical protein